ncbi:MAG: hypothetical protein EWM72_02477 [Nitrospira sp.]|nr:MAG: hypothetical protein EWM72_02477 [Nitrospira sp.]
MEERVSTFLPLACAPSLAEQSVDLDKIALLRCPHFSPTNAEKGRRLWQHE